MIDLPHVIGHRGACAYAPENTLASFAKAKACGATWVEFDVQCARDGSLMIIHDDNVSRTTNGSGRVTQKNYDELKQLDAGNGEAIPTLAQTLDFLQQNALCANVELKPQPKDNHSLVQNTVACVQSHWHAQTPLLFSSSAMEVCALLREHMPDALIGVLLDTWHEDWHRFTDPVNAYSVHINYKALNQKNVAELKEAGFAVLSYTVNDPNKAAELLAWGVDSVFSDVPDQIIKHIRTA